MGKTRSELPLPLSYEGILFEFSAVEQEISNFAKIARKFIDERSRTVIDQWLSMLLSFRDSRRQGRWRWQITECNPVRTKPTYEYESRGKSGGFLVYGELSMVWEIEAKGRGSGPAQSFYLKGLASTMIKVFRLDSDQDVRQIAQWTFEVGDHQSPGCHFHVGIPCLNETESSFPVPRLPSILLTPIDALDFLLGEIFQVPWRQEVSRDSDSIRAWAGHQQKRLSRLLEWKRDQVKKSGGSAWNYLKNQRPQSKIFLE